MVREAAFAQIDQCNSSELAAFGVVDRAEAQCTARRSEEAKVLDGEIVEINTLRTHVCLHLLS